MRQAGGARRRIRFGLEGILDLFGVDGAEVADLRRIQDALSVAGLGLEPELPDAADDDSVQVWLASERLAHDEHSAAAQALTAEGGRFEPAGGRRLDRRSAQTIAALLPGVLLPVVGVAVLGRAFAIAFVVAAIALSALVRWRASLFVRVRWPFGALGVASSPRTLGASLLAASGAVFVVSAVLGPLLVAPLVSSLWPSAEAQAAQAQALAGEAARDRARLEDQADRGRALAVERGLEASRLRARVLRLERRVRAQRRQVRAARRRRAAAAEALVAQPIVPPVPPAL